LKGSKIKLEFFLVCQYVVVVFIVTFSCGFLRYRRTRLARPESGMVG
jgi:hypothetical protein